MPLVWKGVIEMRSGKMRTELALLAGNTPFYPELARRLCRCPSQ
jgi:hypothetical protein